MTPLKHKLLHNIHQYHLILPVSKVVVAVSGGADSMALLHILLSLKPRLGCQLHVATLDHGLRGNAGAADAAFVRDTAEAWGLPVTTGKADLDPNTPGVETRAREARYRFLIDTAREVGADRISTAHHANDQAETVLMHLIRGGGVRGLAGMTYSSQFRVQSLQFREETGDLNQTPEVDSNNSTLNPQPSALHLIRPMLNITRAEIEAYCAEHNIEYRHDGTNDQPYTLRNILRLQTLPHLRELNPQIVQALNRLAEITGSENHYLEEETRRFIDTYGTVEAARVTLSLQAYQALHIAMQRRIIQECLSMVGGLVSLQTTGFERIEAGVRLMQTGQVGAVAQMPGGVQVRMGYDAVYIERADAPEAYDGWLLPKGFEREMDLPGFIDLPDRWRLTLEEGVVPQASIILTIPLNASVTLRTRRPGDRFAPKGMKGHTRKLKDWMIDRKIPQSLRDHLPLLVVNGQIAVVLSHPEFYVTEPFRQSSNPVTLQNRYIYVTVAKI